MLSKYILVHSADALDIGRRTVADARQRAALSLVLPAPKVHAIGLWDLGAWLGGLTRLIEAMNAAQHALVFFEVKATVPAGLISQPQRVSPWLKESLGRNLTSSEERDIQRNLIANDFFGLADEIRADLSLDLMVGITPSMVAGIDEEVYWNHFSTSQDKTALVSTYELRDYAIRTHRPFETFLAYLIIAQVLVTLSPDIDFHHDRGCLFDYNGDRVSLMDTVRDVRIEEECLDRIPESFRPAAHELVIYLRSMNKE